MKYTTPECEVLEFNRDDIITTSTDTGFIPTPSQNADADEGNNSWF